MPPPLGCGNRIRMKRECTQFSTIGLFRVEVLVEELETEPSFAMTNFTTIFPNSFGFLFSSFW